MCEHLDVGQVNESFSLRVGTYVTSHQATIRPSPPLDSTFVATSTQALASANHMLSRIGGSTLSHVIIFAKNQVLQLNTLLK